MTSAGTLGFGFKDSLGSGDDFAWRLSLVARIALGLAVLTVALGCQTPQSEDVSMQAADRVEGVSLREGDVVKVSFPGAPSLNTTQQIRRDGRIALPLIGEVNAAGLKPSELERQLLALYSPQLVTKEVTVTVESSSFPVFVTGAVIRPGKILSNRPITALEAIMEAGGVDHAKANLAAVTVTRNEQGHVKSYTLNLKLALEGKQSQPFYLKPCDIVYVPERFSWF